MDVVVEVLKDLYRFVFVYYFGLRASTTVPEVHIDTPPVAPPSSASSHPTIPTASATPAPSVTSPLLDAPAAVPLLTPDSETLIGAVGYIITADAFLYALPTRTFDGVIARLAFGTSLEILSRQGKWLHVVIDDERGWLEVDDVTETSADLYPQFTVGTRYDADHEVTVKLRTLIDDMFHASALSLPLQNVEYVVYKLQRKGRSIIWGPQRPRLAGSWQQLLRGTAGIHIGVHPKTGAVMEYALDESTAHIVYVESVFPDSSIAISEVGQPHEGVYGERTMQKEEWLELKPVFIEVM